MAAEGKHSKHLEIPKVVVSAPVDDLIKRGTVIRNRWITLECIGKGGFGAVFQCFDLCRRDVVAMKVESKLKRTQVLKMEVQVLRKMQGCPYVCLFLGCGKTDNFNYIVMNLCGDSLSDLRRRQESHSFSLATTMFIAIQCIESIRHLHEAGYLHRDIKPGNFTMGRNVPSNKDHGHTVFIIDFGLARKYLLPNGKLREARNRAGFRGTLRYASLNCHKQMELGRHDDLWSLFYGIVELLTGGLPWRKIASKEGTIRAKETAMNGTLLAGQPRQLRSFIKHIEGLNYDTTPKYGYLIKLLQDIQKTHKLPTTGPLDWEQVKDPTSTQRNVIAQKGHRKRGESNTGFAMETIPELDSDQEMIVNLTIGHMRNHGTASAKEALKNSDCQRKKKLKAAKKKSPVSVSPKVNAHPPPCKIHKKQPETNKLLVPPDADSKAEDVAKAKRNNSAQRLLNVIMNATKPHKQKKKSRLDSNKE